MVRIATQLFAGPGRTKQHPKGVPPMTAIDSERQQTLIDDIVHTADLHGHRTTRGVDPDGALVLAFWPYPEVNVLDIDGFETQLLIEERFENWPYHDIATEPVGRIARDLYDDEYVDEFDQALDTAIGVRVVACFKLMSELGYDWRQAGDAETAAWLTEHLDFEPPYAHLLAITLNEYATVILEAVV